MTLIVPAPPGEAVAFDDSRPGRLAPLSTRNLFVVGTFDRGLVGQFADVAGLRATFGQRVNYSPASDEIAVALAEGASLPGIDDNQSATITASRAVGAAATTSSVTTGTVLKVSAAAPGAWGDSLKVEVASPGGGTARRLIVTEGATTVATSPIFTDVTALHAWAATSTVVRTASVGTGGLPPVTPATALVGGADDRASLGVAGWTAALGGLDRKYGPGFLIAPGVTDPSVLSAIIPHLAATNRVAQLQLPLDVTEAQSSAIRLQLAADFPDDHWRAALWASHGYATPIGGEPERLVGYSAVQAGIASRVEGLYGIGAAPFGLRRGVSATVSRLARQWSTGVNPPGELQRLYASRVNAAVDTGQAIYAKGYRTLDADPLREDMHVAGTRMRLAFAAEQRAATYGGENGDKSTLASYHADLIGVCKTFADARAFNTDGDIGYRVEVDTVNTRESLANRELHGRIRFRPNGSIHWTDVLVGATRPSEQI